MKTISTLTESDLIAAFQLEQVCHAFPWSEATFRSNQGERYINQKITIDNRLAGFIICQTVADEATLFNIAVHPDFRRKGLATTLLTSLIDQLTTFDIKMLWLEVRASNSIAMNLYQQLGFNEITIRKNYYPAIQGQEDAIIMAYTISL